MGWDGYTADEIRAIKTVNDVVEVTSCAFVGGAGIMALKGGVSLRFEKTVSDHDCVGRIKKPTDEKAPGLADQLTAIYKLGIKERLLGESAAEQWVPELPLSEEEKMNATKKPSLFNNALGKVFVSASDTTRKPDDEEELKTNPHLK